MRFQNKWKLEYHDILFVLHSGGDFFTVHLQLDIITLIISVYCFFVKAAFQFYR